MPLSIYSQFINEHLTLIVLIGKLFLLSVWLSFLFIFLKFKKQFLLLAAIISLGSLYVIIDMLPLSRPYSLEVGYDRIINLASAISIAEGNKIMSSAIYKNIPTVESPVLPFILAIINWFTNISIPVLYTYSPLLITIFLPLFIYFFWSRTGGEARINGVEVSAKNERAWEAILIAFFAMFFTTDLDILKSGFVKGFWQMMFLVKPNHSITFLFIFPYLYFVCRSESFYDSLRAGLFLSLIIISHILFGALVLISTIIYIFLRKVMASDLRSSSVKMIVVSIIIGLIASSWYWRYFITFYSPFTAQEFAIESAWFVPSLKRLVFDPFESTLLLGHLFWLGIAGIIVMIRRKSRADLAVLSVLLTVYFLKFLYPISYILLKIAPEPDELSYFIRFALAICAGVGTLHILKWVGSYIGRNIDIIRQNHMLIALYRILNFPRIERSQALFFNQNTIVPNLIFLTFFISTPILTPIWFFPNFFDFKWKLSMKPIDKEVILYTDWIRRNTKPSAVFLAASSSSQWVVSLTGRKVALMDRGIKKSEFDRRHTFIDDLFRSNNAEKICDSIVYLEIDYFLKDRSLIDSFGNNFHVLISAGFLTMVYETSEVQIYKVLSAACDRDEKRTRTIKDRKAHLLHFINSARS